MPLMVIDFPYTPEGMQLAQVVQQGVSQAMPDAKIQVIDQEGAPAGDAAGGPPGPPPGSPLPGGGPGLPGGGPPQMGGPPPMGPGAGREVRRKRLPPNA
jgi:hypothetical protein